MPLRILIVEHHSLVRSALRSMLGTERFEIVAEVGSSEDALRVCSNGLCPNVALVAFSLPDSDGIALTGHLLSLQPQMRIILLTGHEDHEIVVEAVRAGVKAVVTNTERPEVVLDAIEAVRSGGSYLSRSASVLIMDRIHESDQISQIKQLRVRELQVVRLVAEGLTNKEIADRLELSVETIRSYRKRAMKVMGAKNGSQLTNIALRERILFRATDHR